jgi:hypothetical protein
MKREDDDGNDIDTIIDRSFIIYQNNSRNLGRIFAILCGAGLIFFFLAVLPYFFIVCYPQPIVMAGYLNKRLVNKYHLDNERSVCPVPVSYVSVFL